MNGHICLLCQLQQISQTLVSCPLRDVILSMLADPHGGLEHRIVHRSIASLTSPPSKSDVDRHQASRRAAGVFRGHRPVVSFFIVVFSS